MEFIFFRILEKEILTILKLNQIVLALLYIMHIFIIY